MKIGIFTDSYLPIRYGMETSIESFRVSLEKLGHEVYIYAPNCPGYKDESPNVFRFVSWQPSKKADMRLSLPISKQKALRDIINFPLDVVHAQTPFTLGMLGKYIAKRQKIPMVYTHHTDFHGCIKSYLGNAFFLPYLANKLTRWFCNLCDTIISPSAKISDSLQELNIKKPVHVLPTGADLDKFARTEASEEKAKEIRQRLGLAEDSKVIMTLSRVGKEKNIDFLIDSMEKIKEKDPTIKLVIVGKGPYLADLKKKVETAGLSQNILFAGFITDEEKPFFYQAADAFVYSSWNDTQSIVVLEAVISGLPVIAVNDSAFHGMVTEGVNGYLVDPSTPENFASKVVQVLNDETIRKTFSKNSLQIGEHYSEIKLAEKLIRIYKES